VIKYFHIIDDRKVLSPLRAKCVKSLQDKLGGNEYAQIIVKYSDDICKMIARVDAAKLHIAATVENACIVDTDCFISTPIHEIGVESGKPYFAKYEFNSAMESPDICYFYVNGCCDYFKNNLPESIIKSDQYGFSPEILQGLSNYGTIPEMSYFHYYESMVSVGKSESIRRMAKELDSAHVRLAMFEKAVEQMCLTVKMGRTNGTLRK
jgi:hypothetical protein